MLLMKLTFGAKYCVFDVFKLKSSLEFKVLFREVYCHIYKQKVLFAAQLRCRRKRNFQLYVCRYISPNENFEYRYPLNHCLFSKKMALFCLSSLKCCMEFIHKQHVKVS